MKANELMMGDWVIVYEKSMPAKAKVEGVYGKTATVLGHQRIVEKYFVEPIPLTPEILEKNGFKERGYEELVLEADDYCFALQKGVDGINAWWWEMFCSPIIPINHVHELQHVLRLCGIEKEIKL